MNIREFKEQVKAQYPDFKTLPIFKRIKVLLTEHPTTRTDSSNNLDAGVLEMSQTYKTFEVDGKEYFYKFGW